MMIFFCWAGRLMDARDKKSFMQLLAARLAEYGKALPESMFVDAWFKKLMPYPLVIIEQAFCNYQDAEDKFAPNAVAIANRCVLLDGRPSDEEAWAMSLVTQDEMRTVVWTDEMAAAFATCAPVLNLGDKVGARMAFREFYAKAVASARSAGIAARWSVLPGLDKRDLASVLKGAMALGQIAPDHEFLTVEHNKKVLLLGCDDDVMAAQDKKIRSENTQRLREVLATLKCPLEKMRKVQSQKNTDKAASMDELKRVADEMVNARMLS
jgi:hypothetical protein